MSNSAETKFLVVTPLAFDKEAIKAVVINRLRKRGIKAISTDHDRCDGSDLTIEFAYNSEEPLPSEVIEEIKKAVSQAAQVKET